MRMGLLFLVPYTSREVHPLSFVNLRTEGGDFIVFALPCPTRKIYAKTYTLKYTSKCTLNILGWAGNDGIGCNGRGKENGLSELEVFHILNAHRKGRHC